MLLTTNQLPTLGYVHKVVCDCLGLWNSDNEDVTFHVAATEKERRAALREAFATVKREDGTYGSHDELIAVTTRLAPKDAEKVKKSKTLQAYVNHLAKTDFDSAHEYRELHQYIETLLTKRYGSWGVSGLAVCFYVSALAHYQEFVREYACNTQSQTYSYQFFISQYLRSLTKTLTREMLPEDTWPDMTLDQPWPLREFADEASRMTGISLHKLHQYHQFQQKEPLKELAWAKDFTSQQVNTRSKQVIERLRKPNRMKWETFYPTLQPLVYHLPKLTDENAFAIHAFAAMIAHNLNVHVNAFGPFAPPEGGGPTYGRVEHWIPSSELLEFFNNDYPIGKEPFSQQAPKRYQALLEEIGNLPGSLTFDRGIANSLDQFCQMQYRRFNEKGWHEELVDAPIWLNEWVCARKALFAGDAMQARSHFNEALEQAKYAAGPLFIPFYMQVCAFCKSQYQLLSKRNETEVFDRLYESLGSNASRYAELLGYTPRSERDPNTLIHRSSLPVKSRLIMNETSALSRTLNS